MLQSEFYQRTKVNLTPEDYAEVEAIYNALPALGKDEFCKLWLKIRNNSLFDELKYAYLKVEREARQNNDRCQELQKQLFAKEEEKAKEINRILRESNERSMDFARKLILSGAITDSTYDIIEEEFGIGFIIRTKHEAGIPLLDEEISYLVNNL